MPDRIELLSARHLVLTWGIAPAFGGMTSAMLRRSQSLASATGRPVDLLTLDPGDDQRAVEELLRSDGRLPEGIRLRNLWEELEQGQLPLPAGTKALHSFAPLPATGAKSAHRVSSDGTVLQVDRYRADGTLAVSDRRDARLRGAVGGRSIVVCDASGKPVGGFTRARSLYGWWLDAVIGEEESVLIVDSKTAAESLSGYRSSHATRIHVLHNSHLQGDQRPFGPVKRSRRTVLRRLADWDAVVVLSERQRSDIVRLLGSADNLEVIPNAVHLPAIDRSRRRDPASGAVVAALDARKRVDHSLRALALAHRGGAEVRLDVFGDGPDRGSLEALAEELGVHGAVRFHGFRSDAARAFDSSSFFLLTSRSEGFPLVLLEGMGRGCIPVAYDIPYGPADIIRDGHNGFLLRAGDVSGLGEVIRRLATSPHLSAMREAAVSSAEDYGDEAVLDQWAAAIGRARRRRMSRGPAFRVTTTGARLDRGRRIATATVDFSLGGVDVPPSDVRAAVALSGTRQDGAAIEVRADGRVRRTLRHGVWRAVADFPLDLIGWIPADVLLDGTLELQIRGRTQRVPLPPSFPTGAPPVGDA